jgi:hypothetical protein
MQTFVASLMSAVLAIQAVFGCCWHHAHFHLHCQRSLAQAAAPAKCCHHHHASESKPVEPPCQGHDDCQGSSDYLVPQKVQLDATETVAVFDMPAIVSLLSATPGAAQFSYEYAGSRSTIELPLRLHLLHQTLLI